jgi:hypothetical protein
VILDWSWNIFLRLYPREMAGSRPTNGNRLQSFQRRGGTKKTKTFHLHTVLSDHTHHLYPLPRPDCAQLHCNHVAPRTQENDVDVPVVKQDDLAMTYDVVMIASKDIPRRVYLDRRSIFEGRRSSNRDVELKGGLHAK